MARDGVNITDLRIPTPGVGGDSGADAANAIVVSIDAIDLHDHTEDKGARITSAAININDTLDFNGQAATAVKQIIFSEQGSSPTDLNSIYSKADGELYYRDDAGNEVQVTAGGAVNVGGTGTLGGVSGAAGVTYASGSYAWSMVPHDSTNGAYANLNMRDLRLNGGTSGVVAIKPAATIVSYNLTLPGAAPAANQFLMSDGSGIFSWQNACINGSSGSAEKLAVWSSATTLKGVGPLTDGQILIGATSAAPVPANITGTSNRITVTNGTNSITLNTPQDLHTSANVTFNQATLTTLTGNPTSSLGNTTVTGTLNVSGNTTLTTMAGTGTRVAYVNSSGQFTPGVAAATTNTADTIVLRDGSGGTAVGTLTCNSVNSSGAVSGTTLTGSSLNVGSGSIACGAATVASLNAGSGAISGGAISGASANITGDVTISGFTTFGSSGASFKVKKLSTGLDTNGNATFSHGLTGTKIMCIQGRVQTSGLPVYLAIPGNDGIRDIRVEWGATTVTVTTGFYGYFGASVVLYAFYEV